MAAKISGLHGFIEILSLRFPLSCTESIFLSTFEVHSFFSGPFPEFKDILGRDFVWSGTDVRILFSFIPSMFLLRGSIWCLRLCGAPHRAVIGVGRFGCAEKQHPRATKRAHRRKQGATEGNCETDTEGASEEELGMRKRRN